MGKGTKEIKPYWRPDFRIASTLPDIKAVRTDFIINFVAVTLVLICGFYLLQREYRAFSLERTIEDLERRIKVAEAPNRTAVDASAEFKQAARKIVDLEKFYDAPFTAPEFIVGLSRLRPDDLIFNRINATRRAVDDAIEYRITINGEVRELPILNTFRAELEAAELLAFEGYETAIDEMVEAPDDDTRIFPYQLVITASPAEGSKNATEDG